MTPDEAIEKARWYEREDIATTLREEANVLANEVERLRERVARLEEALVHISIQDGEELIPLADHAAHTLADGLRHCGEVARAALKGTP